LFFVFVIIIIIIIIIVTIIITSTIIRFKAGFSYLFRLKDSGFTSSAVQQSLVRLVGKH
jgi:hypothetical protein